MAEKAKNIITDLDPTNKLIFLRIKTKDHEIMFSPDKEYQIFTVYEFEPNEQPSV